MDYSSTTGSNTAATRAERFEDEKRRIIDSCFNKKDTDGLRRAQKLKHGILALANLSS